MTEKIGRNDLCLCGSGKKYKNCCLQKEQHQKQTGITPLSKRKFTAKVISSGGTAKSQSQDQEQNKKAVIDYNNLMERSFGNAIHSAEQPPIPTNPAQYLVEEKKQGSDQS
jgi:uncharacterized protein